MVSKDKLLKQSQKTSLRIQKAFRPGLPTPEDKPRGINAVIGTPAALEKAAAGENFRRVVSNAITHPNSDCFM